MKNNLSKYKTNIDIKNYAVGLSQCLTMKISYIFYLQSIYLSYPVNTGKPIVAVLINAPAKIIKGIKGYFSIMVLSYLRFP